MKNRHLALLAIGIALIGTARAATIVISQPSFSSLSDFPPTGFGQSFTADGNYSVTAINLYISASSGGSNLTLRLYDFNSATSQLGTKILGSGALLETDLSSTANWKSVAFDSSVKVMAGSTYAFTVIAKDPGGSATGWNNYGRSSADAYAGGNLLGLGSNNSVNPLVPDLSFQVVAVPEPGLPLLLSATITLFSICRTRHRIR